MGKRKYDLSGGLTEAQVVLVMEHIEYARTGALKHFRVSRGRAELEELLSCAYLGLVNAAIRYRKNAGASFKSFAFQWIEKALKGEWQQKKRADGFAWTQTPEGQRLERRAQRKDWPLQENGEPIDFRDEPRRRIG